MRKGRGKGRSEKGSEKGSERRTEATSEATNHAIRKTGSDGRSEYASESAIDGSTDDSDTMMCLQVVSALSTRSDKELEILRELDLRPGASTSFSAVLKLLFVRSLQLVFIIRL
jgi:hypothetical protein